MSQSEAILLHLQSGEALTAYTALQQFGCLRLAARIDELRRRGVPITTEQIQVGKGKRVAMYSLDDARQKSA